jgi:hypothetical protein
MSAVYGYLLLVYMVAGVAGMLFAFKLGVDYGRKNPK